MKIHSFVLVCLCLCQQLIEEVLLEQNLSNENLIKKPEVATNKTLEVVVGTLEAEPIVKEELVSETWSGSMVLKSEETLPPTVVLVISVRNKAHALPNYLGLIDLLAYPKQRISLFVRTDHNVDNSSGILKEWLDNVENLYNQVNVFLNDTQGGYEGEQNTQDWPDARFHSVMQIKEEAFDFARAIWADFIFFVDADNMLENPDVLTALMKYKKTIVAPMLLSLGRYSNWWGDMSDDFYYKRSPDYMDILNREKTGLFEVPMVHSTFLVDLRRREGSILSYKRVRETYPGPYDDIIIFAYNARNHGVKMWLSNEAYFGKLTGPLDVVYGIQDDKNQFTNMKLESLFEDPPMPTSKYITGTKSKKDKLGFDEIYLINLKRRPDRLQRMMDCFEELGVEPKLVAAVDGQELTKEYLAALDIKQCANYRDPYSLRDMTYGEIGCFMSHYKVWEDVVQHGYQKVVVFEDDIRFEPYFRIKVENLMTELKYADIPQWDLIYLGRKRLRRDLEPTVRNTESLVWASYSYWTLSYILSNTGAQKLLNQRPLSKLVPVDEYLPIMFDRHPEEDWKQHFTPRDLYGLSADPLLCYPTHYTGEKNYISDTEESDVIPEEHVPDADAPQQEKDRKPPTTDHKTSKSAFDSASTGPSSGGIKDEL